MKFLVLKIDYCRIQFLGVFDPDLELGLARGNEVQGITGEGLVLLAAGVEPEQGICHRGKVKGLFSQVSLLVLEGSGDLNHLQFTEEHGNGIGGEIFAGEGWRKFNARGI